MLFSNACNYGLRAALYLASRPDNQYVSISNISEELNISPHFLTKILQELTKAGLMESMKGPKGGIRFTKPEDKISLLEIVVAIDGMDLLTECALGLPGCGIAKPCPLHDRWADARDEIRKMLEKTTLADLVLIGKERNLRLAENDGFNWIFNT